VITIDPKKLLDKLKATASIRKQHTLELIHEILERQTALGDRDFSIANIGRLSSQKGGPSPQAIRNKGGEDYRRLIEAWAASYSTTTKKPLSQGSRNVTPGRDEDILKRIEDPALRAVVGAIIAERNRYLQELRVVKGQMEIIIDRRPAACEVQKPVELLPSLSGILTESEREALEHAVSDKLIGERGWEVFPNGRVKDQNGRHLYKPGYITALKKVLNETVANSRHE